MPDEIPKIIPPELLKCRANENILNELAFMVLDGNANNKIPFLLDFGDINNFPQYFTINNDLTINVNNVSGVVMLIDCTVEGYHAFGYSTLINNTDKINRTYYFPIYWNSPGTHDFITYAEIQLNSYRDSNNYVRDMIGRVALTAGNIYFYDWIDFKDYSVRCKFIIFE